MNTFITCIIKFETTKMYWLVQTLIYQTAEALNPFQISGRIFKLVTADLYKDLGTSNITLFQTVEY